MNHLGIYALYPNVRSVDANGIAKDIDGTPVTIDMDAVNAWVDPDAYKEHRARAYPSFADQFDLLYHGGLDAWKAAIDAVKQEYPKP
jgi:rhodanese-related sulfurtransferase